MIKISIQGDGPRPIGAPAPEVVVEVGGEPINGVRSIHIHNGVELVVENIQFERVDKILAAGASVRKADTGDAFLEMKGGGQYVLKQFHPDQSDYPDVEVSLLPRNGQVGQ
jgi:hypothetical protein